MMNKKEVQRILMKNNHKKLNQTKNTKEDMKSADFLQKRKQYLSIKLKEDLGIKDQTKLRACCIMWKIKIKY